MSRRLSVSDAADDARELRANDGHEEDDHDSDDEEYVGLEEDEDNEDENDSDSENDQDETDDDVDIEDEEVLITDGSEEYSISLEDLLAFVGRRRTRPATQDEDEEIERDDVDPGTFVRTQHTPFQHSLQYHGAALPSLTFERLAARSGSLLGKRKQMYNTLGASFQSHDKVAIMQHRLPTKLLHKRLRYGGCAFCGQYSEDGSVFVAASQEGCIHLHDTQKWETFKTIEARDVGWSIVDIDSSSDSRWVIYSSWSPYVHLINVYGDYELHEALDLKPLHHSCMFGIRFSPNNAEILAGANQGFLYLFDVERKQTTLQIRGHTNDINTVDYASNDPNIFFTGSDDTFVKVWDRRSLMGNAISGPVGVLAGHHQGITCVTSKGDDRHLISNSKDHSIKLWDIRSMISANEASNLRPHSSGYDYRYGGIRSVRRRMLEHDTSLNTYYGHKVLQTLIRCYFSPLESTGQRYIYSGSYDGVVYIWDALTGEIVQKLDGGHDSLVRDVSWHPFLPQLMSTSWDTTSRRWEFNPSERVASTEETTTVRRPSRARGFMAL